MLVEITEEDLRENVIPFWQKIDAKTNFKNIDRVFNQNIKRICGTGPCKDTLEPFLRRQHLVIHAGSAYGSDSCRDVVRKATFDTAFLAAKYGFNIWYGGGKSGLMGEIAHGFDAGIEEFGRLPDQYSIQIIPADFVLGVKSANGLRPKNEGLCDTTDAAIVMPDLATRRELLDSRCTAAITCPGGIGSLDEWTDVVTKIKTGIGGMLAYAVSPYIEEFNCSFYDPLKSCIDFTIKTGFLSDDIYKYSKFVDSPQKVFEDMMPYLESKNITPNQVYTSYCKAHGIVATVPSKQNPYRTDSSCAQASSTPCQPG